jgi:hypothetical protein
MILDGLIDAFRPKVQDLLQRCETAGYPMRALDGLRTPAAQARVWRRTRTTAQVMAGIAKLKADGAPFLASVLDGVGPQPLEPGEKLGNHLTKVLPGQGWHQWGEAVDCGWYPDGEYEDSETRLVAGKNGYHVYADIAEQIELTAGGHWPTFQDWPHVQYRNEDNAITAGMSWPDIDAAMKARFGADPLK